MTKPDAVNAVNNVFYYINNCKFIRDENGNYYPEIILKADWPCGTPHIKDKWMEYIRRQEGNEREALITLYANLDNKHRRVMTEWVLENYDCGYTI